jgi:hypothetical protein
VVATAAGVTYVVYPGNGSLHSIINSGTAVNKRKDGISEGTSPTLVAYGNNLVCLWVTD